MTTRRKQREPDILLVFGQLSDDVLIDDLQFARLVGRSPATIKRWRRKKKIPPPLLLNGRPRHRVGDIRPWLKGEYPPA